jgi:sarcosine oxidase
MAPAHDVVIVGAGLLGLAAARSVGERGRDFVVLERAAIGHPGAGSKGSCRVFRLGYPEPDYVTAARHAGELWRELEAQASRRILTPAPHLTFGQDMAAVHDAMRRSGAPCELLGADAAAEQFPEIRTGGPALLEPESGVLAADAALAALAAAAGLVDPADPAGRTGPEGARLRTGVTVTGIRDDGRQVAVQTTAGVVTGRTVVVTAGPATADVLSGSLTVPTTPTLEQVAYFEPAGPPRPAPIFIRHGDPSPYGLPVPGSDRYKIGIHRSGPVAGPDFGDQSPDPVLLAELAEVASRYLPGYRPDPVATERCVYDNSPDEDFIVDRVGNVVLGCGTSGHGFKFGPLFGEWLAALALDGPGASLAGGDAAGLRERFSARRVRTGSAPGTG